MDNAIQYLQGAAYSIWLINMYALPVILTAWHSVGKEIKKISTFGIVSCSMESSIIIKSWAIIPGRNRTTVCTWVRNQLHQHAE